MAVRKCRARAQRATPRMMHVAHAQAKPAMGDAHIARAGLGGKDGRRPHRCLQLKEKWLPGDQNQLQSGRDGRERSVERLGHALHAAERSHNLRVELGFQFDVGAARFVVEHLVVGLA
jgi:hypothetical protein